MALIEMISDSHIRSWAANGVERGGSFVSAISKAFLNADEENFALLRPVAQALVKKYPRYLENDGEIA